MAKAVKTSRILSFLYQKVMRQVLKTLNTTLIGLVKPTLKLQLTYQGDCGQAYTTVTGKEKDIFRVVLGGGMVAKIAMLPDSFSSKATLKTFVAAMKAAFLGLNYHEMGHVFYTDMTLEILLAYDSTYRGFVLQLFNIVEDPTIENAITRMTETLRPYDTSPRVYFNYMKEQLFRPQCEDYTDDGTINSFLNYLLLVLRCGKHSIKNTNAVYEKYSVDIIPMLKAILLEPNPKERQVKTVTLADWIIHNVVEFDWSRVEAPRDLRPAPKGSHVEGGIPVPTSTSGEPEGSYPDLGDEDEKTGGSTESTSSTDDSTDSKPRDTADKKKDDGDKDGTDIHDVETDEIPEVEDCFNDLINAAYSHEFIIAKDEYVVLNEDALMAELDKQLDETRDATRALIPYLKTLQGRTRPRRTPGYTSGRPHLPSIIWDEARDGCSTKLFSREVIRGKMTDVAILGVGDNSGSIIGIQSTLASIGMIGLAQACEWAKIPFAAMCFTKTCDSYSGTSITIIEKDFDEPFEKAKPFFAINDSKLIKYLKSDRDIPTFRGNSEEVNLFHIGKEFVKTKYTVKVMLVFCDGATTGSKENLKQVVRQLERDGILVIGIGLMAREVADIYPHHKIFTSLDDIKENLVPYLMETLSLLVS